MIINYESVIDLLDVEINKRSETYHNDFEKGAVHGVTMTKHLIQDYVHKLNYSQVLHSESKDALINIKEVIDHKIKEIEEKFKIYEVSLDGCFCLFFLTLEEAKEALINNLNENMNEPFYNVKITIDTIYIKESDLHLYI